MTKGQAPLEGSSANTKPAAPEVKLRSVAKAIVDVPQPGDEPVDKPIEELERADIATVVWQRIGKDPNHGIGLLATTAEVPEAGLVEALAKEAEHEAKESENPWKHLTLEAVVTVALTVLAFFIGWGVYGILREDEPELAGFEEAVTRSFAGTTRLTFTVAEFDSDEHAEQAFHQLGDRIENAPGGDRGIEISDVASVTVPAARDGSAAYQGNVRIANTTVPISVVFIRDGEFVHIMVSLGSLTDTPGEPMAILGHVFGEPPYAELVGTPAATEGTDPEYTTGGVWDRLPSPHDLPDGYVVVEEFTGLSDELFGDGDQKD